jgi:hypothetical protein
MLPHQVLPCQLTEARLIVKVNAPSRSLRISTVQSGEDRLFQELHNPNGVFEFVLNQPEQLQLDAQRGLQVTLDVTESDAERQLPELSETEPTRGSRRPSATFQSAATPNSFTTWQIDYVRLDVAGRTQ